MVQPDIGVAVNRDSLVKKFTPNIVQRNNKPLKKQVLNNGSNGKTIYKQQQQQIKKSISNNSNEIKEEERERVKPNIPSSLQPKKPIPKEIIESKRLLPVYTARDALIDNIKRHQSVVIISETGTGKTTQIPQYLRESGFTRNGIIAITQPRRVAAISIAKRVAEEIGGDLGDEVGYNVRFDDKTSENTRLKYMTDGMLVREAMIDPLLSSYSVIMLDEAHERTLNTDVLFGLLKAIQKKRPSLKLVVMSATLDAELFSKYFNNAPVLYIEGRQFPVRVFYAEETQKDYLDAALVTILQIHTQDEEQENEQMELEGSDILVFLSGREEIEALEKLLIERIPRLPPNSKGLIVCPIYSALPQEQQMKVFEKAPKGMRKVIIATNIAETSLTINGIRYVVDSGVAKTRTFNPKIGIDVLAVQPISQASAKQRCGRAGREFPGKCYRLYTEELYNHLLLSSIPEIKRTSISNVILQLKTIGVDDIYEFDFLERPPLAIVKNSLQQLCYLDALDNEGNITEYGKKMSQFPLEPMYSKTLIQANEMGCLEEVLIIISMLSVESIFYSPKDKQKELESIRRIFFSPEGDHITLLNVFREYQKVNGNQQWCFDHFINTKSMVKVISIFEQLIEYCSNSKMNITTCESEMEIVRKCFVTGFFMNVAILQPNKTYKTCVDQREIHIHPTSFMFDVKPSHILYNELTVTSKAFARNVIPIEPNWLVELVPKFYGIRNITTNNPTSLPSTPKSSNI